MKSELEIGKWYVAKHGHEVIEGQCVSVNPEGALLRFRWGGPIRTRQFVSKDLIIGQTTDPRWIAALFRLLS